MSSKMLKVYQLTKTTPCSSSTASILHASSQQHLQLQPHQIMRLYSRSSRQRGIIGGFIENLKEEFNKNKEMKESIKKFREEREKLEKSDALKEARSKFVSKSTCFSMYGIYFYVCRKHLKRKRAKAQR